ncbi:hypothetical protein AMTR_s00074p00135590 [Amborella trichopoda]|uniref:Uncharacterized protein n=1 Tax=Amborella trichopoda TaxID=13333 RepID=W1NMZ3_AMBTC|nr:hypothetical protein AMTR_s00074p00135590 [Amborella trichopoda]
MPLALSSYGGDGSMHAFPSPWAGTTKWGVGEFGGNYSLLGLSPACLLLEISPVGSSEMACGFLLCSLRFAPLAILLGIRFFLLAWVM